MSEDEAVEPLRDSPAVDGLSDDGIRPEVIEYIDMTYADDDGARAAARQLARALERQVAVEDALQAQQVAHEIAVAITCLDRADLSDSDVRVQLETRTFDTEERMAAERRFSRMLSGRVVMLPTDPECAPGLEEAP